MATLYLHSVAEVCASGERHHGQQASSCPDVQDDDLLTAGLHPGHSRPDALVILLILEVGAVTRGLVVIGLLNMRRGSLSRMGGKRSSNLTTYPVVVMKHVCITGPEEKHESLVTLYGCSSVQLNGHVLFVCLSRQKS